MVTAPGGGKLGIVDPIRSFPRDWLGLGTLGSRAQPGTPGGAAEVTHGREGSDVGGWSAARRQGFLAKPKLNPAAWCEEGEVMMGRPMAAD